MATLNGIDKGYEFLANQLPATPILSSWTIDGMVGCKISFKSEHLQKTGSFKTRGALHNMRILAEKESKGVITHSSGNHGQAVAWAAHQFSIPCTVVVPENTPAAKIDAIEGYRARVVRCGNGIVDRLVVSLLSTIYTFRSFRDNCLPYEEETCDRLAKELSLDIIQPFDTVETIEGQGSLGLELRSQLGEIESLFVSVGGGGLAAGLALALPDTTLYLVEPQGKELRMQLDGSHNDDQSALDTIADGIRVRIIGDENKRILANHPKVHIITVSEEEIREALILIWTRLKQHVEPTAAVAFAGLRQMAASSPLPFSSTTVILCGGNIDTSFIP